MTDMSSTDATQNTEIATLCAAPGTVPHNPAVHVAEMYPVRLTIDLERSAAGTDANQLIIFLSGRPCH